MPSELNRCPVNVPSAVDLSKVGTYPPCARAGGGGSYDAVLEYRVWVHSDEGDDFFEAFPTCKDALDFSKVTNGAECPLALVQQGKKLAEWQVGWIHGKKQ